MIKIDQEKGKVEMSGSITEMLSELTNGAVALIENMPTNTKAEKDMSEHLLKAFLFQIYSKMDELGFSHEITAEEMKSFKRTNDETPEESKKRMIGELLKILFDGDDDPDDDETEDDVPDFMF